MEEPNFAFKSIIKFVFSETIVWIYTALVQADIHCNAVFNQPQAGLSQFINCVDINYQYHRN